MFNHYKCETTATISALFCKVLGGHTCTSDILFINTWVRKCFSASLINVENNQTQIYCFSLLFLNYFWDLLCCFAYVYILN